MKHRNHIIAATDFSAVAENACRYAVLMARQIGAHLTFMHIYRYPVISIDTPEDYTKIREYFDEGEKIKIQNFRLKVLGSLSIDAEKSESSAFAVEGNVATELMSKADRLHADFLVVGTHGATGFRKYIIGSNAWNIIDKSNIPVFAIPQNAVYTQFKNLIFATAYNPEEIPSIHFVTGLAKIACGKVTVLHVSEREITDNEEMEEAKKFQKEIIAKTGYDDFDLTIVHAGNVVEMIDGYSAEKKADCIILTNNKSMRIENILPGLFRKTKKLSLCTHVPLLIMPAYYKGSPKKLWQLSGLEYDLK